MCQISLHNKYQFKKITVEEYSLGILLNILILLPSLFIQTIDGKINMICVRNDFTLK